MNLAIGYAVGFAFLAISNLLLYGVPIAALVLAFRNRRDGSPKPLLTRALWLVIPISLLAWQGWLIVTDYLPQRQRMAQMNASPVYKTIPTPKSIRHVVTYDDFENGGSHDCRNLCRALLISNTLDRVVIEVIERDGTIKRSAFQRSGAEYCADTDDKDWDWFNFDKHRPLLDASGHRLKDHCLAEAPIDPLPSVSLFFNRASPDRPAHFRQGGSGYYVIHLQQQTPDGKTEVLAHAEKYFAKPLVLPILLSGMKSGMEMSFSLSIDPMRKGHVWYGHKDAAVLPALGIGGEDLIHSLRMTGSNP